MAPLTAEQKIEELTKAIMLAQDTIKELNQARATAIEVLKRDKERITHLLVEEVTKQVGEISDEARGQMLAAFDRIADKTSEAIREKLGL